MTTAPGDPPLPSPYRLVGTERVEDDKEPPMTQQRAAYRTCPLCEATCGLELTIADDRITSARGDREHVFSEGFVCPKGAAFGQLVHDPDRLRRPLVRRDCEF